MPENLTHVHTTGTIYVTIRMVRRFQYIFEFSQSFK